MRESFKPAVPSRPGSPNLRVLLAQQLPDALWMTGERKLWSSNTIKLLGNIIGRLIGVLWLLQLRGDNESHHSLLGWKKRSLSCGDVEWACACTYMCLLCYICSPVRLNKRTAVCFNSAERSSARSQLWEILLINDEGGGETSHFLIKRFVFS